MPPAAARALPLLLALLAALHAGAAAANAVAEPIVQSRIRVFTRPFAQLPRLKGNPARIVALVAQGSDLYAVSFTRVHRVRPDGSVALYVDVADFIKANTDRFLSLENGVHGGARSIAFHPDFADNGLVYVSAMETRPRDPAGFPYISDVRNPIAADSVVFEMRHNPRTMRPVADSYRLVFRVGMPVYDHPIKQMAFRGGFLYIAHGDGSVQSAVAGGGQRSDALGKILRIDPRQNGERPYRVPRSNPFVEDASMKSEVWALGFRNPHHICFGRDGTLFAADSGRANVEEVNVVEGGRNYGWPQREGTFVHVGGGRGGKLLLGVEALPGNDSRYGFEYPAAQYGHEGEVGAGFIGQAIAGGCAVENGSRMSGKYYYADFPITGALYFSKLGEMRAARTRGAGGGLTQAVTRQMQDIWFDHDNDTATAAIRCRDLGGVVRSERGLEDSPRADVRFGRGSRGELYWSSKLNGKIYLFTSSLPRGVRRVRGVRERKPATKSRG